jgi:hypothetical protein
MSACEGETPPDAEPAVDRRRTRETGRCLAEGYLKDPPLLASDIGSEPAVSDGLSSAPHLGSEPGAAARTHF